MQPKELQKGEIGISLSNIKVFFFMLTMDACLLYTFTSSNQFRYKESFALYYLDKEKAKN